MNIILNFIFLMPTMTPEAIGMGGVPGIISSPLSLYFAPDLLSWQYNRELEWTPDLQNFSTNLNFIYSDPQGFGAGIFQDNARIANYIFGYYHRFSTTFSFGLSYANRINAKFDTSFLRTSALNVSLGLKDVMLSNIPGRVGARFFGLSYEKLIAFIVSYNINRIYIYSGTLMNIGNRPFPFLGVTYSSKKFFNITSIDVGVGINENSAGAFLSLDLDNVKFLLGINNSTYSLSAVFSIASRKAVITEIVKSQKLLKEKEEQTSNNYLEKGIAYYNDGNLEEALNSFDIALVWNSNNRKASRWYNKVVAEKKRRDVLALIGSAKESLLKKDYLEAMRVSEKVLKLDSSNEEALSIMADAERGLKNELFNKSSSSSVETLLNEGVNYYRKGKFNLAKSKFNKAYEKDRANKKVKRYVSKTEGKIVEVVKLKMDLLEKYMKKKDYLNALSVASDIKSMGTNTREINRKIKEIRGLIRKEVDNSFKKGIQEYEKGHYVSSKRYFLNVLQYEPNHVTAKKYLNIINKKITKKDTDKLYLMGLEAYTNHDYQKALSFWQQVEKLNADYPNLKSNIRRVKEKIKLLQSSY